MASRYQVFDDIAKSKRALRQEVGTLYQIVHKMQHSVMRTIVRNVYNFIYNFIALYIMMRDTLNELTSFYAELL